MMQAVPATREPLLPWWAKLILGAIALVWLILGSVMLLGQRGTNQWEQFAAGLRSEGLPLTFEEIEAQRAKVPEDQNGARIIERLAEDLDALYESSRDYASRHTLLVFGGSAPRADFFEGIPEYSLETSGNFLAEHQALRDQLAELRECPTGRFNIAYATNPLKTSLPHRTRLRTAAKLLHLDSVLRLAGGDVEGAVETVFLQQRLAATLHDEPFLISRLVQMAIDALAVANLENVLRVGPVEEDTLQRLEEAFEDRLASGTMKWSFLGERAFFVETCEQVARGRLTLAELGGREPAEGLSLLPEAFIRSNQVQGAEMLTWLVDAADDAPSMTKAAKRIAAEIPELSVMQFLSRMLIPSVTRTVILHQRVTARLRCARIALAAERFRLHHERLPSSIDALVPAYLEAVPADPFDGDPLRFAVTDNGIVIYSIDQDLNDDDGSVVRQQGEKRARDSGFRLLAADRRGPNVTSEPRPAD